MKYRLFIRKVGGFAFLQAEPERHEYSASDWEKANKVAETKRKEAEDKAENSYKIVMLAEIK